MRFVWVKLAPVDARDLAVLAICTEGRVDPPEPVEHPHQRVLSRVLVTDVDDDRHTHDLLDDGTHALWALRIADCSEPANASLV